MVVTVLKELTIIFSLYFLGKYISDILGLKHFGGLFGMAFLFILLHLKILTIKSIEKSTRFLLKNMAFFFIPAGVSILATYTLLKGFYIQSFLLLSVTTLLVMLTTGVSVSYLVKKAIRDKNDNITYR